MNFLKPWCCCIIYRIINVVGSGFGYSESWIYGKIFCVRRYY